jgi:small acid-soluble spore protein F (minor alpha/beta-type SASP)
MSRHSIMSEALKQEIARRMGVEDTVRREGWGAVSSRDCGRMVQSAIEMAEQSIRP